MRTYRNSQVSDDGVVILHNYIILPNGCWKWLGALSNGYGVVAIKGKTQVDKVLRHFKGGGRGKLLARLHGVSYSAVRVHALKEEKRVRLGGS